METLQELTDRRDRLKKELIETEMAISRHPDKIKGTFRHNPMWDMTEFDELMKRVSFIRPASGWTNSHRNPVQWGGYVLQFDDMVCRLRKGGNWCSDIFDYGPEGQEVSLDHAYTEELWHQDDPIRYLKDNGVNEDWKIVGYLLTLSIEM